MMLRFRFPHRKRYLPAQSGKSWKIWNKGFGHKLHPCWWGRDWGYYDWQGSTDGRSEWFQGEDPGTAKGAGYLALHVICLEQWLKNSLGWKGAEWLNFLPLHRTKEDQNSTENSSTVRGEWSFLMSQLTNHHSINKSIKIIQYSFMCLKPWGSETASISLCRYLMWLLKLQILELKI